MMRETFVAALSDIHIGKRTPAYSTEVAGGVLSRFAQSLRDVAARFHEEREFDEFVLFLLGDILDGDDIYPGQAHYQDLSVLTAQAWAALSLFIPVVEAGLDIAPRMRVVAVPGNHGRAGRHAHTASNWDNVFYQQLQLRLALEFGQRVSLEANLPVFEPDRSRVHLPDPTWLRVANIKGHYYLLHHGHGINRVLGIPYYGLLKRAYNWRATIDLPWRVHLCGHYHQFAWIEENGITILLCGTAVKDDVWALEKFGSRGVNRTWTFGVNEEQPITWSHPVDLV